jgi:hypothetical protein
MFYVSKYIEEKHSGKWFAMVKRCFLLLLLFQVVFNSQARANFPVSDTIQIDPSAGTTNFQGSKTPGSNSLFVGGSYGTNMLMAGSSISGNQHYVSSDLLWSFLRDFWASVKVYNLPGVRDHYMPLSDFSVGYSRYVNKWFDVSASAATYRVVDELREMLHNNFSYFTLSAGFDWRYLYTRATIGHIPGKQKATYYYLRNSHYFSTTPQGSGGSFFSFDPAASFLFGDYIRWELFEVKPPGGLPVRPGYEIYDYELVKSTAALQAEFSVPVSFNIRSFTLEAEPIYLIPLLSDKNYLSPGGFHFYLTMYFRLF